MATTDTAQIVFKSQPWSAEGLIGFHATNSIDAWLENGLTFFSGILHGSLQIAHDVERLRASTKASNMVRVDFWNRSRLLQRFFAFETLTTHTCPSCFILGDNLRK